MKIAIVDDQETDRKQLAEILRAGFTARGYHLSELDTFSGGEEILDRMESIKYDAVFLDIYMGQMNGIETARKIRASDKIVRLVFITSSNDFASESYSVRASDYLLKPYTPEDIDRVIANLALDELEARRTVTFADGQVLPLSVILYTSYSGHYVSIHETNGRELRVRMTQSACAELLLSYSGFVSCNKGMLVNMRAVEKLEEDRFILNNGAHIPISRRRYGEVKKEYFDFLLRQVQQGSSR